MRDDYRLRSSSDGAVDRYELALGLRMCTRPGVDQCLPIQMTNLQLNLFRALVWVISASTNRVSQGAGTFYPSYE